VSEKLDFDFGPNSFASKSGLIGDWNFKKSQICYEKVQSGWKNKIEDSKFACKAWLDSNLEERVQLQKVIEML
jgi:hypothetical protein